MVSSVIVRLILITVRVSEEDYIKYGVVKCLVRQIFSRKSARMDNIENVALKNVPNESLRFLRCIINSRITLWKSATVIPICKPGKSPNVVDKLYILTSLGLHKCVTAC
uniref:Uncharacterized protein n=1 Tax=Glossina austeni TaxID=7395 RepID=A0A1A9VP41_GLOAU